MKTEEVWLGDALELMKNIPDGSIDMVLTSPPFVCNTIFVCPTKNLLNDTTT